MPAPEIITDLDVNKMDIRLPHELKRELDKFNGIEIFEDTIQITLFDSTNSTLTLWIYKTGTQVWTKLFMY